MTTVPAGVLQWTRQRCAAADTNLRKARFVTQGDPQCLDTDSLAAVTAFPYIGKATKGGRLVTDFGEITGYAV